MYNNIMVPLDGSELAECVFPHLEAIASGCGTTKVVFVRVVDPARLPVSVPARGEFGFREKDRKQLEDQRKSAAREYLERIADSHMLTGTEVDVTVLAGKIAESLTDFAENNDIDLILIASHGRSGISRWVLGSVAERTLRSSCVPVLMVRAPGCEVKG